MSPSEATKRDLGLENVGDRGVGVTPDVLLQEQKRQPNPTSPKTAPPRERSCVEVPFDTSTNRTCTAPEVPREVSTKLSTFRLVFAELTQ